MNMSEAFSKRDIVKREQRATRSLLSKLITHISWPLFTKGAGLASKDVFLTVDFDYEEVLRAKPLNQTGEGLC